MVEALLHLVIYLLIVGTILWLLLYLVDTLPMFAPFQKAARIVIMVIGVVILIYILLGLLGSAPRLPRLT
jgi:maltodextrin utilization protein YvdJ